LRIFPYSSEVPRLRRIEQRGCGFPAQASVLLLTVLATFSLAESDLHSPPLLSSDVIVQRLMAANAQRSQALRAYSGKRVYHLDYHGIFGSHDAGMQVEATYSAPDRKEFKILSESGSKLLINHVLLKLLSSEQEAQQEKYRKELEISPTNYDFSMVGTEHTPGEDFYVLAVRPKGPSRYLYRGKMWVDAKDFAVARMQGEPARNPSLWVSHTEVEYRWGKIGEFWLPVYNQSETQVRMGGKAVLTIDYSDYQVTGANRAGPRSPSETSTLPNPAAVSADPH
jgi:hypothetical protein